MNSWTTENPVFVIYLVAASLVILKLMFQGWMTVYRMIKSNSGWASPEDLREGMINRKPDPDQMAVNDYVDRSRRMHRNDLENIPGFLFAGLIYVAMEPTLLSAQVLMFGFVGARALHFLAYATEQSHELRATFYTIGSLIVIYMAVYSLWTVLF